MNNTINNLHNDIENTLKKIKRKKHQELLDHLSTKYYDEGISLVTNEVFDIILDDYVSKYGEYSYNDDGKKNKTRLPYYVGSQDKIKSDEKNINSWKSKYSGPYVLSNKINGVSCLCYNDNGSIRIFTKDRTGINGYEKTKYINNISFPHENIKVGEAIRGELIISKKDFEKYFANEYSDSLTAVGSIINSDHSDPKKLKKIKFIGFGVINPPMKQSEQFSYLESLNIETAKYEIVDDINSELLTEKLIHEREEYKYAIDGIVVCDDSIAHVLLEGKNPKYSFAFKTILNDQYAETTIINIEWNVQKNGNIVPTIKYEPIVLLGKNHKSVAGHNAKFIKNNCLGPGSRIVIIKSGDIIPKVHKVITPSSSGNPSMPEIPYIWDSSETHILINSENDVVENVMKEKQMLYCIKMLDVQFIKESTVKKIVARGYDDLFKLLQADRSDLIEIDGLSEKTVSKIYLSIEEKIKKSSLAILMAASNCFGYGMSLKKFEIITDSYPNILSLYEKHGSTYIYGIVIALHGYAEKTAKKISDNIKNFYKWHKKLRKIIPEENHIETVISEKTYDGKIFVLTGFRDKELEDKIISLGGKISNSVSKKTFMVIAKDINESSKKINDAHKNGINVVQLDDLTLF